MADKGRPKSASLRIKRYLQVSDDSDDESPEQPTTSSEPAHHAMDRDIARLFSALNVSDISLTREVDVCRKHGGGKLSFYCTACEQACCMSCRLDNHTKKECQVKSFAAAVINIISKMKNEIYSYCKQLRQFNGKYRKQYAGFYEKIEKTATQIEKENPKNMAQILDQFESVLASLSKHNDVYQSQKAQAVDMLTSLSEIQGITPSRALRRLDTLQDDMKTLTSKIQPLLSFKLDVSATGKPGLNVDVKSTTVAVGDTVQDIKLVKDTGVLGILKVFGRLLILHNKNNRVQVYKDVKPEHEIGVPDMQQPTGIMLLDKTGDRATVVISDCYPRLLHFLTISSDCQMKSSHHVKLSFSPHDMSYGGTHGELLLTNLGAKDLYTYNISTQKETLLLQLPTSVIDRPVSSITQQGEYVVVDRINNQVVWLKENRDILHQYGRGDGDQPLDHPYHVREDTLHNLLVADQSNHRVQVLDQRGRFLRHLVQHRDGLTYPLRLYLDQEEDLLYIGHGCKKDGHKVRAVHYTAVPTQKTHIHLYLY